MPTVKGYRQLGEMSGSIELGDKKVISRYALEYVVLADNAAQGTLTIRSTPGLPIVGYSTYSYAGESDPFAVCKKKSPRRDTKQPLVWYVRCDFDDDPNSQSEENEENKTSAVNREPDVSWDAEYGEEVMTEDFSTPRKPIVTPNGHPFDPPVTRRVIYPVLIIERFETTFTPATILAYEDHVNDDAFYGAPAGSALMAKISARKVVEDGTRLWRLAYRIRFAVSADGYDIKPLNQDTHYKEGSELKPFIAGNVPYIGNVNADGTKAADGVRTFSTFKGHPEADFGPLALE